MLCLLVALEVMTQVTDPPRKIVVDRVGTNKW